MSHRDNSALWLAQTGVLLALLIGLQYVTKPLGQLVTGSCVNAVLAVTALVVGYRSGCFIGLLSPIIAFFLNIGPQFFPVVVVIALGNGAYALILRRMRRRSSCFKTALGVLVAAVSKFLLLYLGVVQGVCRLFSLQEPQVKTFSLMFSYPQLITALIGGAIALCIAPLLWKKGRRH